MGHKCEQDEAMLLRDLRWRIWVWVQRPQVHRSWGWGGGLLPSSHSFNLSLLLSGESGRVESEWQTEIYRIKPGASWYYLKDLEWTQTTLKTGCLSLSSLAYFKIIVKCLRAWEDRSVGKMFACKLRDLIPMPRTHIGRGLESQCWGAETGWSLAFAGQWV